MPHRAEETIICLRPLIIGAFFFHANFLLALKTYERLNFSYIPDKKVNYPISRNKLMGTAAIGIDAIDIIIDGSESMNNSYRCYTIDIVNARYSCYRYYHRWFREYV